MHITYFQTSVPPFENSEDPSSEATCSGFTLLFIHQQIHINNLMIQIGPLTRLEMRRSSLVWYSVSAYRSMSADK